MGNKRVLRCPICNYQGMAEVTSTRDYNRGARYGLDREFEYGLCPGCGCMWLLSVPDNLGDYYGNSYYSFSLKGKGLVHLLMEKRDIYELEHRGIVGKMMHGLIPRPAYGLVGEYAAKGGAILDVGCGDGYLLSLLGNLGYTSLSGCDRFIPLGYARETGMDAVRLVQGTVGQCEGIYDLIYVPP